MADGRDTMFDVSTFPRSAEFPVLAPPAAGGFMRNHITHVCAAMAIAALGVACGGRTSAVNNDRRAQSGGNRGVNERIVLRGCVQPAVQGGGYALRHVMVLPPAEQPQGQDIID